MAPGRVKKGSYRGARGGGASFAAAADKQTNGTRCLRELFACCTNMVIDLRCFAFAHVNKYCVIASAFTLQPGALGWQYERVCRERDGWADKWRKKSLDLWPLERQPGVFG